MNTSMGSKIFDTSDIPGLCYPSKQFNSYGLAILQACFHFNDTLAE